MATDGKEDKIMRQSEAVGKLFVPKPLSSFFFISDYEKVSALKTKLIFRASGLFYALSCRLEVKKTWNREF